MRKGCFLYYLNVFALHNLYKPDIILYNLKAFKKKSLMKTVSKASLSCILKHSTCCDI